MCPVTGGPWWMVTGSSGGISRAEKAGVYCNDNGRSGTYGAYSC